MRIAGLIAFWVGVATFWIVTVSMVVKPGDASPPPQVANGNGPGENETPSDVKPPAERPAEPAEVVEPAGRPAEEPIAAPAVIEAKRPAEPVEPQPEPLAKEEPIKPVRDKQKVKPTLAAKPVGNAKPADKKTTVIEPAVAKEPPTLKKRPAPSVAKTQPPAKEEPSAPRVAAQQKTTPATSSPASSETRTSLVLHVPQDAKVYLDGYETRTTGSVREYATNKLQPGGAARAYSVRVEVTRGGQTMVKERTIQLRAGQRHEVSVDFTPDDAPAASQAPQTP